MADGRRYGAPPLPRVPTISSRYSMPAPGRTFGLAFRYLGVRLERVMYPESDTPSPHEVPSIPSITGAHKALMDITSAFASAELYVERLYGCGQAALRVVRAAWNPDDEDQIDMGMEKLVSLSKYISSLCKEVEDNLQHLEEQLIQLANMSSPSSTPTTSQPEHEASLRLGASVLKLRDISGVLLRMEYNRGHCSILRDRCVEVLIVLKDGWNPKDREGLQPMIAQFSTLLDKVKVCMNRWAVWSVLDCFVEQYNIAAQIKGFLIELDQILTTCPWAAGIKMYGWKHDFADARKRNSDILGKAMEDHGEVLESDDRGRLREFARHLLESLHEARGNRLQEAQKSIVIIHKVFRIDLPEWKQLDRVGHCQRIGDTAIVTSNTYEIWEGLWLGQEKVTLKALRNVDVKDPTWKRKRGRFLMSEDLRHPNLLTCYDTCEYAGPLPYTIFQWCINGNAPQYLRTNPKVDRLKICLEAAYGLQYLHSKQVIHGCMMGDIIHISDSGRALLADFSLSGELKGGHMGTKSCCARSNYRWAAPENILKSKQTKEGDVWAWAMTALELLSGKEPFYTSQGLGSALTKIGSGVLPRYDDYPSPSMDHQIWSLLEACWKEDPLNRPTISEVVERLGAIHSATVELEKREGDY